MKKVIIAIIFMVTLSACNNRHNNIYIYHSPPMVQQQPIYSWVNHFDDDMYFKESTQKVSQLIDSDNKQDVYYISLNVNRHTGLVYESIPWTALLSFEFVKSKPHKDIPNNYMLLLTSYSENDKGNYLGVNAFGVTKNVTITDGKYNGILIIPQFDKESYNSLIWNLAVKAPNKAIEDYYKTAGISFRWDKNVKIVAKVIIHTSHEGISNGNITTYKTPTLDDPVKSKNTYSFVAVKLDSIIYLDKKTNKILMTFAEH